MSEDYGFKFAIGSHVTLAAAVDEARSINAMFPEKSYGKMRPPRLIVVGRQLEQCYGGTQRHYDCRFVTGSATVGNSVIQFTAGERVKGLSSLSEPELIHWSDDAQSAV